MMRFFPLFSRRHWPSVCVVLALGMTKPGYAEDWLSFTEEPTGKIAHPPLQLDKYPLSEIAENNCQRRATSDQRLTTSHQPLVPSPQSPEVEYEVEVSWGVAIGGEQDRRFAAVLGAVIDQVGQDVPQGVRIGPAAGGRVMDSLGEILIGQTLNVVPQHG